MCLRGHGLNKACLLFSSGKIVLRCSQMQKNNLLERRIIPLLVLKPYLGLLSACCMGRGFGVLLENTFISGMY